MSALTKLVSVEHHHSPTVHPGFWRGRHVSFVFSCEHGGNEVPDSFVSLFKGAEEELKSHRGWDPGALILASRLSRYWKAPLIFSKVSRLLVELNRSSHHPKWLSEWSRLMTEEQKQTVREQFYEPYRAAISRQVEEVLERNEICLHASVHSFTPVYHGVPRKTDVGLLYDPKRNSEKELCARWANELKKEQNGWVVRRNHPYLGAADGLTTALRKRYSAESYLGVEIEIKNSLLVGDNVETIARGLGEALRRSLHGRSICHERSNSQA